MQAEKDKVVSFHYQLSEESGAEVESSHGREPMTFLFGHSGIIPGLEQAMAGHVAGDKFDAVVAAKDAYGERREDFVQRVPKKYFKDAEHLRPGMVTMLNTREGGPRQVTVGKIGSSVIDVDLNHPLAGKTLTFDIEITDIRDATAEEISHRHVHAHGDHEH